MKSKIDYFKYRFKYLYGQYLPLTAPVDVSMELSSFCNMRCSYCYHADQNNLHFKTGHMSHETAYLIIWDAASCGVSSLKFNWKGEGTMNPHYLKIATEAHRHARDGIFMERLVNSNFKIPVAKREDRFKALSLMTKVKISMDSFDRNVFDVQRAGGNHLLTLENIDQFYNFPDRIKSDTEMVIQAVRTKLNANEDLYHEIKKRWPAATVSIRDMVSGRVECDTSNMEYRKRTPKERRPCIQAFSRIIFNTTGDAFPCCPDVKEQLPLGNIWKRSLLGIFNGEKAKNLRTSLKIGEAFGSDPCLNCSSFESYKGYKRNWTS